MMWSPPKSAVRVDDMAFWNAAMSYMGKVIPLAQSGSSLRLSPIAAPDLKGNSQSIGLADGAKAYLHLDAFPFHALLGVDFDLETLRTLSGPLSDALYEGASTTVADAFPVDLVHPAKMQELLTPPDMQARSEAEDLSWFAAVLDGLAAEPVYFSVGMATAEICAVLKAQMIAPHPEMNGLKAQITTSALHMAGFAVLPMADIAAFGPGDMIVAEQTDAVAITLLIKQNIYSFTPAEDGWLCENMMPLNALKRTRTVVDEPIETDTSAGDTAQSDTPNEALGDVVSTLMTFDLGETEVSLAELESFQAGALVLLPESATSERGVDVTLRAAGKAIATGDLVQIDDRIAVRINRLLVTQV